MEFFEGAEKKIVIQFDKNEELFNTEFWKQIIKKLKCNILNIIKNDKLIMFLLSESIMFVKLNVVMLKTCGKTTPLKLIKILNEKNIKILNIEYYHPNFLKSDLQNKTYQTFKNEINYINKNLLEKEYKLKTYETLHMNYLQSSLENILSIYEITLWDFIWNDEIINMLHTKLKNWKIDEFNFNPCGYSMNTFNNECEEHYLTIHVTPNTNCSYLSFETNDKNIIEIVKDIINIIKPKKIGLFSNISEFDIDLYNDNDDKVFRYKVYSNGNIYVKYYS